MQRLKQVLKSPDLAKIRAYLTAYKDHLDHRFTSREYAAHLIAQSGNVGAMEVYLKLGGSLSYRDNEWLCPLAHAVRAGHLDMVKHMIGAGADPNNNSVNGRTIAFIPFQKKGEMEMLKFLHSIGTDFHHVDIHGRDPLYLAVHHGWVSGTQFLLEIGSNPTRMVNTDETLYEFFKRRDGEKNTNKALHVLEHYVLMSHLDSQEGGGTLRKRPRL